MVWASINRDVSLASSDLEKGELSQRVGGAEKIDTRKAIEDAVDLAAECDAAIIVAGLSPEWESEGFDRPTLALPKRQDELISRVGEANKRTVVVVQAVRPLISAVPKAVTS